MCPYFEILLIHFLAVLLRGVYPPIPQYFLLLLGGVDPPQG